MDTEEGGSKAVALGFIISSRSHNCSEINHTQFATSLCHIAVFLLSRNPERTSGCKQALARGGTLDILRDAQKIKSLVAREL